MTERNLLICPECDKTGKISEVHTELGKIKFSCQHECDVNDFFDNLEEKGKIKIGDFYKQNKEGDSKLLKKTKNISDIIRVNQLIQETHRKYQNNYYHVKSIINLGESIEKEKKISQDIIDIIDSEINGNKEQEKEAIEKLVNSQVNLNNGVKKVILKGEKREEKYKWLRDEGFELISKIRFKNLIELNLARNGITKADYLDNMLLPHLEILNLSENKIIDVKPVADIQSEHIKEIYLQDNQIVNFSPFNFRKKKFKELEILRVENNKIDYNSNVFQEIIRKYGKTLIYKTIDLAYFNNKYKVNFKKEDKIWDLGSKKNEELLSDFYCLINSGFSIECLYLDDNRLQNVSVLSKIPLLNLQVLDLNLNKIISIKFFKKMYKRCKHLKELYLNDNLIEDISPLVNYSGGKCDIFFEELKILTLKNNKFYDVVEINNNNTNNDINANTNTNNKKKIIRIKDKDMLEIFKCLKENRIVTDFKDISIEGVEDKKTGTEPQLIDEDMISDNGTE